NAIPDQTTNEDEAFSFQIGNDVFADEDAGDQFSYTATLSDENPLPTWLSLDVSSRTFSGVPSNADVGILHIRLIASDLSGASVFDEFAIEVININDAPTVNNAIPNKVINEDELFEFMIPANTFVDVDLNDQLSITADIIDGSPFPSWLNFDNATNTFSGTPTNDDLGTIAISVSAIDQNAESTSTDFTLEVINVNDAPTVANAIPDQTTNEDEAFSFQIGNDVFADEDAGDQLSYTLSLTNENPLPNWLNFDELTLTFSGVPSNDEVGILHFRFMATDLSGASVFDEFSIEVININDAPTLGVELVDQTATALEQFDYLLDPSTFLDIDQGDQLTIRARLIDNSPLPSWLGFNFNTMNFLGIPQIFDEGSFDVVVTATDSEGASISDTFNIEVIFVLSVKELSDLVIHPNPVSSHFTISGLPSEIKVAKLIDMHGVTVKRLSIIKQNEEIYVDKIPSGIYLLMLNSDGNWINAGKVMVKH
ncbi:MAG: putative Ig domain-containing protein, partial [Cyclobacteriaceae bacterium]